jgi:hypothetical protein
MQGCGINLLIIISFPFFLFADYYLSFQLYSNDFVLQKYTLNCSKALTNSNSSKKLIFKIKTDKKSVLDLCKQEKDKIILNLLKNENYIYSKNNVTKLTFPPKRFDIIIKNGYVYFYLREEK